MTKAELIAANNEWRQQLEDAKKRESIACNIIDQQRRIIDEQRREIDELKEALREVTEWISVYDELPTEHMTVLVKCSYTSDSGTCVDTIILIGIRACGRWNIETKNVIVTHWRPITSPKAEQILKKYEK